MPTRGLENVRQALGKPLTGARRYVLGLGRANDAFGHGITELTFEDTQLIEMVPFFRTAVSLIF